MAKMGRPTEYSPDFIDKVDEYLASCQDKIVQVVVECETEIDEDSEDGPVPGKTTTLGEKKQQVNLPTIEGFALFIGVSRRSVFEWAALTDDQGVLRYPDFAHSLEKINTEQQKRLLNKGLSGEYNSTIAKLVLSANHNMREKADLTSDNKPLPSLPITGMRIIDESNNGAAPKA